MLGAIFKQVMSDWEHIPQKIETELFYMSEGNFDGQELEPAGILKLLISTLRTLKQSYICIDALDEFPREHRPELFKSLVQITRESPGTRLFMTGRQHIREEVGRYFTSRAEIQIIPSEEDIKKYLDTRLSKDTQPGIMSDSLREEILTTILENISEMYVTDIRTLSTLFTGHLLTHIQVFVGFVKHERDLSPVNYSRKEGNT